MCQAGTSDGRNRNLDSLTENGEISDIACDIAEANEFLQSLEHDRLDVFELNVFAGLLSALPQNELTVYCEHLKTKEPKSLEEAVYKI